MTDTIPARVLALAKLIDDTPLAWNEREDGSIVIVFCNKGKREFTPEATPAAPTAEAEELTADRSTPAQESVSDPLPIGGGQSQSKSKKGNKKHGNSNAS